MLLSSNLAFEIDPEDKVVEVNQTNIELRCQSHTVGSGIFDSIIWQIYLRNGTFWTVTGADEDVQLGRLGCITIVRLY